jgi:hypothetical protein
VIKTVKPNQTHSKLVNGLAGVRTNSGWPASRASRAVHPSRKVEPVKLKPHLGIGPRNRVTARRRWNNKKYARFAGCLALPFRGAYAGAATEANELARQ